MKTINFLMAILLTLSFMSCNAQKNDKKIDVAALPAVAQELIKSNFADEQIKDYAAKNYADKKIVKIECNSYGYEIELDNGVEIKFDKDFNATIDK